MNIYILSSINRIDGYHTIERASLDKQECMDTYQDCLKNDSLDEYIHTLEEWTVSLGSYHRANTTYLDRPNVDN